MKIEKRMAEIKARKIEIRSALANNDENLELDAVQKELELLEVEERSLEAKLNVMKSIANGEGDPIEKPQEKRSLEQMTPDEVKASPEYRSAFFKALQGKKLTEVEERALTTAANSAGSAVPTTTQDMIVDKLRQTSVLFPLISTSFVPGNMKIVVANAKNASSWHTEGSTITAGDDTVVAVDLKGYELVKLVSISKAALAMSIGAFESYIVEEIARQMAIAIENAIINGDGTDEPTGILPGITWVDDTNATTWANNAVIGYDEVMDALALLPTMYHNNGEFIMNRKMLFGGVRKIKGQDGHPLFAYNASDKFPMSLAGYQVILNDYMPDNTIILGDPKYYHMNISQGAEIEKSTESNFAKGLIDYRGFMIADGKPKLAEAFVKIYRAAS